MTGFERIPARLDEFHLLSAAVRALSQQGHTRTQIESELMSILPVDLDLLAECFARLTGPARQAA